MVRLGKIWTFWVSGPVAGRCQWVKALQSVERSFGCRAMWIQRRVRRARLRTALSRALPNVPSCVIQPLRDTEPAYVTNDDIPNREQRNRFIRDTIPQPLLVRHFKKPLGIVPPFNQYHGFLRA